MKLTKSKPLLLFSICFTLLFFTSCSKEEKLFTGGDGTENNPYKISSQRDLIDLSNEVNNGNQAITNSYFIQIGDIDLKNHPWEPIGQYSYDPQNQYPFTGIYDGGGYLIKNITINEEVGNEDIYSIKNLSFGLFGYVSDNENKNTELKNINVSGASIDVSIDEGLYGSVGGLVGNVSASNVQNPKLSDIVVSNCTVTATAIETNAIDAGFFVGNNNGIIKKCISIGTSTINPYDGGAQNIGGFVGWNSNTIVDSNSTSKITIKPGFSSNLGGFVGLNGSSMNNEFNDASIEGCYSKVILVFDNKEDIEDSFVGKFAGINTANLAKNSTSFKSNINIPLKEICDEY